MDVEGKLELPHLVRTDAHAVLYGAVVFQCCMKKGERRGQEGRGGGEKGTGGERRGREGDRRGEEGEGEILETRKEELSGAEIQSLINSYISFL